jgi:hypothetical protein
MKKINILYISPNKHNSKAVLQIINENWSGFLAINEVDASALFSEYTMEMILFGCDVDKKTEKKLRRYFRKMNSAIIILDHYGGGTALLKHEIIAALQNEKVL